ncbi:hypothetical protein DIPPA_05307 [Diplonema papillatum]|nr:hypothetical protein DIPPA_05307 [Diplonema papillatum]
MPKSRAGPPQVPSICVVCGASGQPGQQRKSGYKCKPCIGKRSKSALRKAVQQVQVKAHLELPMASDTPETRCNGTSEASTVHPVQSCVSPLQLPSSYTGCEQVSPAAGNAQDLLDADMPDDVGMQPHERASSSASHQSHGTDGTVPSVAREAIEDIGDEQLPASTLPSPLLPCNGVDERLKHVTPCFEEVPVADVPQADFTDADLDEILHAETWNRASPVAQALQSRTHLMVRSNDCGDSSDDDSDVDEMGKALSPDFSRHMSTQSKVTFSEVVDYAKLSESRERETPPVGDAMKAYGRSVPPSDQGVLDTTPRRVPAHAPHERRNQYLNVAPASSARSPVDFLLAPAQLHPSHVKAFREKLSTSGRAPSSDSGATLPRRPSEIQPESQLTDDFSDEESDEMNQRSVPGGYHFKRHSRFTAAAGAMPQSRQKVWGVPMPEDGRDGGSVVESDRRHSYRPGAVRKGASWAAPCDTTDDSDTSDAFAAHEQSAHLSPYPSSDNELRPRKLMSSSILSRDTDEDARRPHHDPLAPPTADCSVTSLKAAHPPASQSSFSHDGMPHDALPSVPPAREKSTPRGRDDGASHLDRKALAIIAASGFSSKTLSGGEDGFLAAFGGKKGGSKRGRSLEARLESLAKDAAGSDGRRESKGSAGCSARSGFSAGRGILRKSRGEKPARQKPDPLIHHLARHLQEISRRGSSSSGRAGQGADPIWVFGEYSAGRSRRSLSMPAESWRGASEGNAAPALHGLPAHRSTGPPPSPPRREESGCERTEAPAEAAASFLASLAYPAKPAPAAEAPPPGLPSRLPPASPVAPPGPPFRVGGGGLPSGRKPAPVFYHRDPLHFDSPARAFGYFSESFQKPQAGMPDGMPDRQMGVCPVFPLGKKVTGPCCGTSF